MSDRQPAVYFLASQKRGTIYVGVTAFPIHRVAQHRDALVEGFTKQYGVKRLVRIELFDTMPEAIAREKQLKNWRRDWKIALIESENPTWRDLALDLGFGPLKRKPPPSEDSSSRT